MWGPNVLLWRNLEELRYFDGSGGIFCRDSGTKPVPFSPEKYFSYFLIDPESVEDLSMKIDEFSRKDGRHEENQKEKKTFFENGGLIDLMFSRDRDAFSKYSRRMLEKMILLPERSAEGVTQRQEIFKVLSDVKIRECFLKVFNDCNKNKRYNDEKTPLIDYVHDDVLCGHETYETEFPPKFLALKNLAGLFQMITEEESSENLFHYIVASHDKKLSQLMQILNSAEYNIKIDGNLEHGALEFESKDLEGRFTPVDMSLFEKEDHKKSEMSEAAEKIRYSMSSFLIGAFRQFYVPAADLIRNIAAFEACLNFADFAYNSKKEWCLPEIIDSNEPFIEIEDFIHPAYYHEGVVIKRLVINGDRLVNVETGANDAGKTQSLRGLGQILHLAMGGFPIPARKAKMSLFYNILTNFGGKDDSAKGRYRKSLERWMYNFNYIKKGSLILADEPTDGTFPETGVRHALLALKALGNRGVPVLMTTHYHDIARSIERGEIPKAYNLHIVVNTDKSGKIVYTHQIDNGPDYKSYGDEVAREVGFTEENLEKIGKGKPAAKPFRKIESDEKMLF